MSKFFKSEVVRDIWIRLNAERIQYFFKMKNDERSEDFNLCKEISKEQLVYDETERSFLRYSLDDLLMLSPKELYNLQNHKEEKIINKIFDEEENELY